MIITVDVPKTLNEKLERDKRRTGLSKSFIVREVLLKHYEQSKQITVQGAA